MRQTDRHRVLTNVLELEGNPYLRLWNEASRRAGAEPVAISRRTVLAPRRLRARWVHLQWPERVLDAPQPADAVRALARLLTLVSIARLRGARVLLTVHNLHSHSARHPRLERILWRIVARLTTDVHLMEAAAAEDVFRAHPRLRSARRHVIPHGNYLPLTDGAPSREAARAALGIPPDACLLVAFGFLRGYKGVEDLLDAFRGYDGAGTRLIVAGRVRDPRLADRLRASASRDPRVTLMPEFLSDEELSRVIRAADGVVLPYHRVLNSGSLLLALSLGRPVLVPRTSTFTALAERIGPEWIRHFDAPLDSGDLARLAGDPPAGAPDLAWCGWDRVAEQLRPLWAGSA